MEVEALHDPTRRHEIMMVICQEEQWHIWRSINRVTIMLYEGVITHVQQQMGGTIAILCSLNEMARKIQEVN